MIISVMSEERNSCQWSVYKPSTSTTHKWLWLLSYHSGGSVVAGSGIILSSLIV